MGGLCVLLLMMFCVGWILCVFFLSMLIPLLILYNGIVGIVLSSILKYGLIVYGSISLVFSIILAILNFC